MRKLAAIIAGIALIGTATYFLTRTTNTANTGTSVSTTNSQASVTTSAASGNGQGNQYRWGQPSNAGPSVSATTKAS